MSTLARADQRPDDHDTVGMLPHDLPDSVCDVCGYACACQGAVL
jgi:hypothetical protein